MPKIGNYVMMVYREESASQAEITQALCAASLEFLPIVVDLEGWRDGKPYRYASLSSIRRSTTAAMAKHGLFLNHVYGSTDRGEHVTSVLRHTSGEYQSSTQVVRISGDMQEQDGFKTMLIKSATKGLLSIITEEVAESAVSEVDATKRAQWKSNLDLALKAIASAKSEADVIRYAALAADRITEGTMSPDAMVEINTGCDARRSELKGVKNADNARSAGTQGPDAPRGGSGAPVGEPRQAAGTGRADVRSGDRRPAGTAV